MPTVTLPKTLIERLKKLSEASGASIEEVIIDKLSEEIDPEERANTYWEMAEEYLSQADKELQSGNLKQASEKIWGAAALAVKAVAYSREGIRLRSHGELWEYIDRLIQETGQEDLGTLWRTATAMHVNFYENWAPKGEIQRSLKSIEKLLQTLKKLSR